MSVGIKIRPYTDAVKIVAGLVVAVLAATVTLAQPAQSASQVLYYTTFRPPALKSITYSLQGDQLLTGLPKVVATLPGADGLAWAPDGDLLVGGETSAVISKVHVADGSVKAVPAGVAAAEQINVWPDGVHAYTSGIPGDLARFSISPFSAGTKVPLHGDDTAITGVGFTPTHGAFYTTGDRKGNGNFGSFDISTAATRRTLSGLRGAHGIMFDPFTGDLFLVGSFVIEQIDPANPEAVLSVLNVPGMVFDQGLADGHGHLLVTSNTGFLVYVDYASTKLVAAAHVVKSKAFLDNNLDAVAISPSLLAASGIGASGSSATAPVSVPTKKADRKGLVIILVAALAVIVLVIVLTQTNRRPRLPRR
jgi:hypothetical protein